MSQPSDKSDTFSTPKAVKHNDNAHSRMPQRNDEKRQQAPHDRPNKIPGENEPSVG